MNRVLLALAFSTALAAQSKVGVLHVQGQVYLIYGTGSNITMQAGDQAVVAISDTGCGIPDKIRDKVFDPFFTTKPVGRGTGQGLAISRSIVVEKHGGALRFEPNLPQGTTFIVCLPFQPPATNGGRTTSSLEEKEPEADSVCRR